MAEIIAELLEEAVGEVIFVEGVFVPLIEIEVDA